MIVNNKISKDRSVIQKKSSNKKKWANNLIEGKWNFLSASE